MAIGLLACLLAFPPILHAERQGTTMTPSATLLDFWFGAAMRPRWFDSTPELDRDIRKRFESLWREAVAGKLDTWKETAEGCLALVIVLDQLPLNMFRGEPLSFSSEAQAVQVTRYAVEQGYHKTLPADRLGFLFIPLMHSENLADQDLSVKLFEEAGLENNLRWARHHRELIRRFGRFPHRNAILGRESSPAEIEYLNSREAFKG